MTDVDIIGELKEQVKNLLFEDVELFEIGEKRRGEKKLGWFRERKRKEMRGYQRRSRWGKQWRWRAEIELRPCPIKNLTSRRPNLAKKWVEQAFTNAFQVMLITRKCFSFRLDKDENKESRKIKFSNTQKNEKSNNNKDKK